MRADDEFTDFVAGAVTPLRQLAFLLMGNWHQAEDVVQDALVKLYLAWPRVRRDGQEFAYARRIVTRTCIDHRRRPWRREKPSDVSRDDRVEAADVTERDFLVGALNQISAGQRAVLVLRFWLDLSVEQTANELNISTGSVKSQTAKGLIRLREVLAQVNAKELKRQ